MEQNDKEKIYVTEPSLPDLDEYIKYLKEIWDSKWLTNNGKFHKEFEEKLADFLGVKYISLFANGTLALITALQALRITGEVITTPYSFVATTHALWWNGINPVFVDIEPNYCNIDANKIEAAITPKTTAILPVHVYGNPAEVEKIQQIADTYGLKVIYDSAHSFGVNVKGNSILNFGDMSILSFHATKVFNTAEGGAIVCKDKKMKKRIDYLKNFGFVDETTIIAPGINAKMNELQAALGLLQLKDFNEQVSKRKQIVSEYRELLKDVEGIRFVNDMEEVKHNYSYFPIFVDEKKFGMSRNKLYEKLKKSNIYARRYFYPLISNLSAYRSLESASKENLPVANKASEQVICLPLYGDLNSRDVVKITKLIRK